MDKQMLAGMYESMVRIRKFEEKISELYAIGKLVSFPHAYLGEEAVAVGVCGNLRRDDFITSTHRAEGHSLAKGISSKSVMAELFGKVTGCCRGKGGSMHYASIDVGVLGATGIVGSGLPIAVGAGLSAQVRKTDQVTVCFFGDGAVPAGAFHEGLNLASIWNLPVIFVCENNLYSTWTPFSSVSKVPDVAARAAGYGMPGLPVDGMDVLAVHEAVGKAVARARRGEGPTLVEAKTYRFGGHYIGDPDIRTREEKEGWLARDPIKQLSRTMIVEGLASVEELVAIEAAVAQEINSALEFAQSSPFPANEEALNDVYASETQAQELRPAGPARELSLRDAINETLKEEMKRDPNIFTYGQGYMGKRGGPFQVGKGLQDLYGTQRVRDAPISELTMIGAALGAAMTGARPIVEVQFSDMTMLAMDQIVNQIAKVRYVFGGQWKNLPLVIRTTTGVNASSGAHHSQSLEALYMHIPGLRVVLPSTPYDAKGLLKTAIRGNDPTIFLEPKSLYSMKGQVPIEDYTIPLGRADVKREGKDLSIFTWSAMVHVALRAAEMLEKDASVEVVDMRTLSPLDRGAIISSVRKTGRALIVHEACKTAGAGAEIAAIIAGEAFDSLKAPVGRVANPDVPIPYSPPLEKFVVPDEVRVAEAARRLLRT